ncbi:MAG TPA: chemotaxis protein CheB [Chloroflexota bacterium]
MTQSADGKEPSAITAAEDSTPPGRAYASPFDIVVLVASLGGPEAVRAVIAALPAAFPAAVLVVQHRTARAQDLMVGLLTRRAPGLVRLAREGDCPRPGVVDVAPADRTLTLTATRCFAYAPEPHWPGHGADGLLASVAVRYGNRAVAVILSGSNDDGASGVAALKQQGGRVLAQDRATAGCFAMPAAAIATGCVDFVLPLPLIAPALAALTMAPGAADLFRVPLPPWARLVS